MLRMSRKFCISPQDLRLYVKPYNYNHLYNNHITTPLGV